MRRRVLAPVPRISFFYGISVYVYADDHNPPHVHAWYGEYEARIEIETGTILSGSLPPRVQRRVGRWLELRRVEVRGCWERAMNGHPPGAVRGLD